jgi:hypothetical protein
MSKNRPFKIGFSKKYKIYGKKGFKIRTDYAAMTKRRFVPRFFSAVKKDNLEELKNGHL